MIEVEHLSKDYGTVVALEDVSFQVGSGEIVGFLGPNGAGKSTTLRILAGFLGATRGRVAIAGYDVSREPLRAKQQLGYMPETSPLYPELRVDEYLRFRAALKGVARRERKQAVALAMERAAIGEVADTLIAHLSKGFRQRVALADALVAAPPLLILDEPTAGLDPNQIREVRALIRELGAKHTILLSTHILSEVEATCDRAVVIDRGRLVAQGSLAELRSLGQSKTLLVEVRDPDARADGIAAQISGVESVQPEALTDGDRRLTLTLSGSQGAVAEELVRALVEASIGVKSVVPGKASLEDVFVAVTEHARTDRSAQERP
jgi:ABC-2 type transport system ATP-binding protein